MESKLSGDGSGESPGIWALQVPTYLFSFPTYLAIFTILQKQGNCKLSHTLQYMLIIARSVVLQVPTSVANYVQ